MTFQPDENLIKKYQNKELKAQDIADFYGVAASTVRNYLSLYDIKQKRQKISNQDIQEYLKNNLSQQDLAEIYGRSKSWIGHHLKKRGVAKYRPRKKN